MVRRLTIGTDFSGIEAPIVALRAMKVPHRHVFSSEIDPHAIKVIESKFKPETLFGDVRKRSRSELPKSLDLYVAGFPCQRFSSLTHFLGDRYSRDSDPLEFFRQCVKVIRVCRPKVFILENVPSFTKVAGGETWTRASKALKRLGSYHLSVMILATNDYGVPQTRKRVYIVGLRKDMCSQPLDPPPKKKLRSIKDFLETNPVVQALPPCFAQPVKKCIEGLSEGFVDVAASTIRCHRTSLPGTINRGYGIYWIGGKRVLSPTELLRLQGFPRDFKLPENLSRTRKHKLIGNAMSVNVLRALFAQIFSTTTINRERKRNL